MELNSTFVEIECVTKQRAQFCYDMLFLRELTPFAQFRPAFNFKEFKEFDMGTNDWTFYTDAVACCFGAIII